MLRHQLRLIQLTLPELLDETESPGPLPLSDLILRIRVLGGEVQRYKDGVQAERKRTPEAYQEGLRDASGLAEAVPWCGANQARVEFNHRILAVTGSYSTSRMGPLDVERGDMVEAVEAAKRLK